MNFDYPTREHPYSLPRLSHPLVLERVRALSGR